LSGSHTQAPALPGALTRIGDTATCLRVAGEMIRNNVFYQYEVNR
jgi:hypothetical protein